MFEIILLVALAVAFYKIASMDDQPGWLWAVIALVVGLASVVIPLPYIRLLIAGVVVFFAMIAVKMIQFKSR